MAANKSAAKARDLNRKYRIFLVGEHPTVRQDLAQLIDAEADLAVVGQGREGFGLLRSIKTIKPDLCLVDVHLRNGGGMQFFKELDRDMPDLPVLILSKCDEPLYAERALRAGARPHITRQEAPQVLAAAIRKVMGGQIYLSDNMGGALLQRIVGPKAATTGTLPLDRFTDRELEVFRLIGVGNNVRQIAEKLSLTVKTVRAHREHIKEKLNLKKSAELLSHAILANSPDAREKGRSRH